MSDLTIADFSKGENNVTDPALLGSETMTQIINCDLITGVLSSIFKEAQKVRVPEHYERPNRSVAKQFGRYYWSNNDAKKAPYYGGNIMDGLGIQTPDAPPILTEIDNPDYPVEDEDEESEEEEEVIVDDEEEYMEGTYKYCITYVLNGYESAPAPIDIQAIEGHYNSITVAKGKAVRVTIPDEAIENDKNYDSIKLYRTIDNGADFYYLTTFVKYGQSIADRNYDDNMTDVVLSSRDVMTSMYYLPPPDGGKFLTENGDTFFLAVEDKLYFSEIGDCHAWNPSNWISFNDTITGIIVEFQGILVFTNNRTYRITGNDVTTITKNEIPTRQGCINYRTCATISNMPIWLSNDGLCSWNGESISIISLGKRAIDNDPVFALSANDKYYLFGLGGVIVYDLRLGGVFYTIKTTYQYDYAWYHVDTDAVIMHLDGALEDIGYYQLEFSNQRCESVVQTGLIGGNLATTEFRKMRISSDCDVAYEIINRLGNVLDSGSIPGIGTREVWLVSGAFHRGAKIKFTFSGVLREICLVPISTKVMI